MTRKGEQFAGLTVAIITPFKDGKVDEAALKKIVDWHVSQGTNGLCPSKQYQSDPSPLAVGHAHCIPLTKKHPNPLTRSKRQNF